IFKRNDIIFRVDISDYIGHYIYFGFKDPSINSLFDLVNPGDTIYDIGANIGFTLLNFAKLTGAKGYVFGFEPDPVNFSQCTQNIGLNNFQNIEVHNFGLGKEKSQNKLYVDSENNRGGNRILTDETGTGKEFSIINVISLDEWVTDRNPFKIDLIKIDTEGYEMNILSGSQQTLARYAPILFIEVDDNNLRLQGHSAKLLIEFLITMGYQVQRSDNNNQVDLSTNFLNCHFDVVCRKVKK